MSGAGSKWQGRTHEKSSRTSFLVASNGRFLTTILHVVPFLPLESLPATSSSAPRCANWTSSVCPSRRKPCIVVRALSAASGVLKPTKPKPIDCRSPGRLGSGLVWTRAKRKEGRWEKVEVKVEGEVVKARFLTKRVAPETAVASVEGDAAAGAVATVAGAAAADGSGRGVGSLNMPTGPFSR